MKLYLQALYLKNRDLRWRKCNSSLGVVLLITKILERESKTIKISKFALKRKQNSYSLPTQIIIIIIGFNALNKTGFFRVHSLETKRG